MISELNFQGYKCTLLSSKCFDLLILTIYVYDLRHFMQDFWEGREEINQSNVSAYGCIPLQGFWDILSTFPVRFLCFRSCGCF